jgi:hypothetical protein
LLIRDVWRFEQEDTLAEVSQFGVHLEFFGNFLD